MTLSWEGKTMSEKEEVFPQIDQDALRLGQTLADLRVAKDAIKRALLTARHPGALRQALDSEEHEGEWLTRPQVHTLGTAVMDIGAVLDRLDVRMDPRCKGTLGERPGWMSPDQYGDPCRCTLPRDHEGDHACAHTLAKADK